MKNWTPIRIAFALTYLGSAVIVYLDLFVFRPF